MDSPNPSSTIHLCVLVHGLWGNPVHLNHLRDALQAQHPQDRLHILVAKSNADYNTYDGIEVGGERVTHEVEQTIRELEKEGAKVQKISVTGYSLGGLVARYAIGLLYKSGVFDKVEPVNFATFATPHLGVRTPKLGYRAYIWNIMGSKTLSTSGEQMFTFDTFRDTGRPLLSIMADRQSIFMKGLRMFKNKSLYANTINDRSVPYYTAFISRTDPYVDLEKVDLHYQRGQEDPVVLEPTLPVTLKKPRTEQLTTYERLSVLTQQTKTTLPFYALLFTLLPIALPAFLVNSVYQTYRSVQRVKLHESDHAGIGLGRYRIPLFEEAQHVQDRVYEELAERSREEYLPTPPPEPASSAISSSSASDTAKLSRTETAKEDSPFPVLALTEEQFEMIDNLDSLDFTKFPVHIQRHRHTHAAIVVRMQKDAFAEGRVVVRHWAQRFEI
ncbi:putative serine esterase-domain-containing protein [Neohortaea acidophila]|uniref:Putative serine esterase-domain-containing protein n=1 Tax=Neohortaea acidophila TaxID=245834 RepID=A0A6A6PWG5_9PEZI|nr:putative serine esterase-domain-containing protein [Neohortaea acidophila]KAF2484081.1 putative serine esterase-domain-containing protein [Neohortaea acidophila]